MQEKHTAISVRLSPELHDQLREAALANERTVAQETRRLLAIQLGQREHRDSTPEGASV